MSGSTRNPCSAWGEFSNASASLVSSFNSYSSFSWSDKVDATLLFSVSGAL